MFLLTEGTLFFLDLALNARACEEKPSLSSVVQRWADEVAAANNSDSSADAHTTTGASSTLFVPLPSNQVEQSPYTAEAHCVASGSTSQGASKLTGPEALSPGCMEGAEKIAMSNCNKASVSTSSMNCRTSDGDRRSRDALLSRWQQQGPCGMKRKADDIVVVSDIELDVDEDDEMTSVGVETPSSTLPAQKRRKLEDASAYFLPVPFDPNAACISAATCVEKLQEAQRRQISNEGYLIEVIKKSSQYTTRDLPVPCDQRWSQSFISTAILWYSVQRNLWHVPKAELASALQRIFDVVYPDVKYRVTPSGSVFSLTMQRIREWRSSFGSSALAMMLHFFSSVDNASDVRAAADLLATDFRFLRADPDTCEATEPFRSPFLLILVAIAHLGDVAACVNVPGWNTPAMVAGEGGEGVVAIASAALERALAFFRDGTLDVDHVLEETARQPDAPLPRTVLDVLAERAAPPAQQFSSANWSGHTAAYRDAVRKRGAAFVRGTFDAAWAKRRKIVETGTGDGDGESVGARTASAIRDPRALL